MTAATETIVDEKKNEGLLRSLNDTDEDDENRNGTVSTADENGFGDYSSLRWIQSQSAAVYQVNKEDEEEQLTSYQDSKFSLDSYDPQVDTKIKPPYSFASLIFMAIDSSPRKALPVKDIYKWITDNFPFYKDAPIGWKNSVRHNLSLSRCFVKSSKNYNLSKGFMWTVDKKFRDGILQTINNQNLLLTQPELLLEREKSFFRERESYLDDIDAAAVMLVIKHSNNGNINGVEDPSVTLAQAAAAAAAAFDAERKTAENNRAEVEANAATAAAQAAVAAVASEEQRKFTGSSKRKRSLLEMKSSTYIDNTNLSMTLKRSSVAAQKKLLDVSDDHNYISATPDNPDSVNTSASSNGHNKSSNDANVKNGIERGSENGNITNRFLPRLIRTKKRQKLNLSSSK